MFSIEIEKLARRYELVNYAGKPIPCWVWDDQASPQAVALLRTVLCAIDHVALVMDHNGANIPYTMSYDHAVPMRDSDVTSDEFAEIADDIALANDYVQFMTQCAESERQVDRHAQKND